MPIGRLGRFACVSLVLYQHFKMESQPILRWACVFFTWNESGVLFPHIAFDFPLVKAALTGWPTRAMFQRRRPGLVRWSLKVWKHCSRYINILLHVASCSKQPNIVIITHPPPRTIHFHNQAFTHTDHGDVMWRTVDLRFLTLRRLLVRASQVLVSLSPLRGNLSLVQLDFTS